MTKQSKCGEKIIKIWRCRARLEPPPPYTREPVSRTRSSSGSYVTRERGLYRKHTFMICDTKADPETKGMTLQDAKAAKNRVVN